MYYMYVLKSLKDDRLYIGYTNNLKLRIEEHQNGDVESTRHRKPIELLYYEAYRTEDSARERERQLKQFGSAYTGLMKRLNIPK